MDTQLYAAEKPERRLDLFLASVMEERSRSFIARLIREGHVLLNGKHAKPSTALVPGDSVEVMIPPTQPSHLVAEPMELDVLYRDDDILVLDKPAGVCVHPGAGQTSGTIVNALLAMAPGLSSVGGVERPGIVHRLDKQTSGCLVIAFNDRAHAGLSAAFKSREVHKKYLTVVRGSLPFSTKIVDAPIGRHSAHRKKMCVRSDGRQAKTTLLLLDQKKNYSLVGAEPETGRTHQIRVHLASLGHPVVGDQLYSRRSDRELISRQALHAVELEFNHPVLGTRMKLRAPLPADMLHLIEAVGFTLEHPWLKGDPS